MSEAKHTPGPWHIYELPEEHRPPEFSALEIVIKPCGVIAQLDPHNENLSASEPNARLISAAPDLLEAAEEILRGIEQGDETWSAIDSLRAAIQKARGTE